MIKLKIYSVGKTRESWLDEALDEYTKRLSKQAVIEWHLSKNDQALVAALEKAPFYFCLDPNGTSCTTETFAHMMSQAGARINFVIGGPLGIPKNVLDRAKKILSLSPLTFTHQMARLILLEQIYRAFEINRGSPYHK